MSAEWEAPDRAAMTRAAVPAMVRLAEQWHLDAEQMCELLGGISLDTWASWKNCAPTELSDDQLTRVSYLLGTYTALHGLFRKPLADEWVTRPNTNQFFGGRAPVEVMATGGIVALAQVRELLDSALTGR
jgi:hypothetical protein